MQAGAHAYARTAQAVANPRELEAQLLLKSASGLQAAIDGSNGTQRQTIDAINFNLKVWKIFSTAATDPRNPQPADVKQYVTNLGIFIMSHSLQLLASGAINREELRIL
eukprot:gene30350-34392_t